MDIKSLNQTNNYVGPAPARVSIYINIFVTYKKL